MHRRDFLHCAAMATCAGAAFKGTRAEPAVAAEPRSSSSPVAIGLGPQLFLDDYFIEQLDGLKRQVQSPQRLPKPVLDSKTFGTTQPYLTVLRDEQTKRFRIWYNRGPAVWHAESEDGVLWTNPRVAWDLPRGYGCSIIDDGARATDPQRRFKFANWQATRKREDKPGDNGGMYVGFSPDGFQWTAGPKNPVLPSYPEGWPKISRYGIGDIVDVYYDALRKRYAAAVKVHALPEDGYAPAPKAGKVFRRLVGISTSTDFLHWEKPQRIFVPDKKDEGLLEFYGMGGMHQRGGLTIGLVRVLRDDLSCDPGGPKNGIGYAVLATSRDGRTWRRYREPFLDRNLEPGSWDHAMTWMSGALPVGDEDFFYYGGYARGHKIEAKTERQIGLARMRRDRYVALAPQKSEGKVVTPVFIVPDGKLTINAQAKEGAIRVRLLDPEGKALDELGAAEATPFAGDALAAAVRWPRPLTALRGRSARLEITVRRSQLFGVDFQAGDG